MLIASMNTKSGTTNFRFVMQLRPRVFHVKRGGIETLRLGWFTIQKFTGPVKKTAVTHDDGITIPPYPFMPI